MPYYACPEVIGTKCIPGWRDTPPGPGAPGTEPGIPAPALPGAPQGDQVEIGEFEVKGTVGLPPPVFFRQLFEAPPAPTAPAPLPAPPPGDVHIFSAPVGGLPAALRAPSNAGYLSR